MLRFDLASLVLTGGSVGFVSRLAQDYDSSGGTSFGGVGGRQAQQRGGRRQWRRWDGCPEKYLGPETSVENCQMAYKASSDIVSTKGLCFLLQAKGFTRCVGCVAGVSFALV